MPNKNIDLEYYARQIYGQTTYYYASVKGEMLNGIAIPSKEPRSFNSGQSNSQSYYEPSEKDFEEPVAPLNLPVDSNSDAIRFFIDTDKNEDTGFKTLGMPIGADKLIEIEGVYGIITKSVVCDYDADGEGIWKWTNCIYVASAANGGEIELMAQVEGSFFIHLTSWDSWKDSTLAEAYMPIIGRDHLHHNNDRWN